MHSLPIKSRYLNSGQGHLFEHWDGLSEKEQKEFERNLEGDLLKVLIEYRQAVEKEESIKRCQEIKPLPKGSYESIVDNSDVEQKRKYEEVGMEAIRRGEVGVILMAGGQGTRVGSPDPKGCYDIGLPSHKSLFQIQAERLRVLEKLSGCEKPIPWYIMASEVTREATERFFQEHDYFGLCKSQVRFFNQEMIPVLDSEGKKLLLSSKVTLVKSPDGNGGLYGALRQEGILDDFIHQGIKHIHVYCVDNVLVKLADPVFIGYAIQHGFQLATKVVRKRDAHESVGLIVCKGGKPSVIEYSEISNELAESIDESTGLLKLRAANIVNHYYSVELLKEKLDLWCDIMDYHLAKKKIPYYDAASGKMVKPNEINGIKLEKFIFDVFETIPIDKFGCLEVERSSEFSPLKNGPGSNNDNPETARLAYLELSTKWLRDAGANIINDTKVEVSSSLSYNGENLEPYKGRTFDKYGEYLD